MSGRKIPQYLCMLAASVSLAACQATTTRYPSASGQELAAERQIQQKMATEDSLAKKERAEQHRLEMQHRLVRVSQPIRKGGMELCRQMSKAVSDCMFEFELTEAGKPLNAYADGKKIYVTPAMMSFADTDEALAVVLGHEYAHNVMGHITSKQANMLVGSIIGLALDMAAATQGLSTGGNFSSIGGQAGAAVYSQDFEREADYVGLYITALAGYNITSAPDFWRKMSLANSKAIVEASTHPSNPERFIALSKTVGEIEDKRQRRQKLAPALTP